MANKHKGLGKGFDVLMPQGFSAVLTDREGERVQNLFISAVLANPDQPRRIFDDESLSGLAESIKQHGVLQPIIVTPSSMPSTYQIIAGERRWRASKLAGLDKIPAIVRSAQELEQLELAIVENIQRVDLSALEQAASISRLHELFSQSYEQIARRLGKAESTVSNIVRLLTLPPAAQDALQSKKISEGHARAILALKDFPEAQEQLLLLIQKHSWSVRQAEQFVTATKNGAKTSDAAQKKTDANTPETESLQKLLKRPVTIARMAKGGRLVIRFKSDDDLDELVKFLERLQ
jgi:ParB family chromosome partitioning protein